MDESLSLNGLSGAVEPQLSRSLSSRHVTMISMGGMIGAGVFVGSSAAIAAVGPAIVLSYLIAGILILLVMRMLAEMATAMPHVRTFTEFARVGLGPAAGFVVGWLYWYFWIITVAVEAIAGAGLLHAWIALPTWILGVGLIAIMTGVNLMSARSFGEFEFWFASIKVAAIIVFIALAGSYACGLLSPTGATWGNLVSHGGFMPHGLVSVLAGVTTVFFSLTGAEITTVAAAESRDPVRALTQMTTSVITRIVFFYVGSIFLIVSVVPWDSIVPGQSPFTHALLAMRFSWAGSAMSLIILTAVLSCLNSAFYVTSRVLFTLAGHNDAPQWMVRLNARHVPARSVLVGTAAGLIGVFAAVWSPGGVFAFLVNASGALILYVYMLTAIAQIRLRRRADADTLGATALGGTTLAVTPPRLKMWWFPWSSYAAIGGIVAVLLAMALTPSLASEFYVSLTTLAVSLAAYALTAYSRSRTRPKHGAADSTTQVAALRALPEPPADAGHTAGGSGSAANANANPAEDVRAQTLRALMELAFGVTLAPGAGLPEADAGIGADIAAILARIAEQPNYAPRRPMQLPKLMRAINDENASRSELAQILAGDPALAGNLLRLANSPFYRYRSDPIESLDRAVAVLGIEGLRSMIAAALLQPVFRISGGSFTQFGEVTWEHSLFALMAAEGHATLIENADPFAAQLLVLMSGLATIVIFTVAQDTYLQRQRTPEAGIIAGLIATHAPSVARQIAASWELSERIDTALAEQLAAAPASALGRSLRFGEFIGALAVLRSRGIIDDQAAHAVLRSAETETGANERIWTRLRAIAL